MYQNNKINLEDLVKYMTALFWTFGISTVMFFGRNSFKRPTSFKTLGSKNTVTWKLKKPCSDDKFLHKMISYSYHIE